MDKSSLRYNNWSPAGLSLFMTSDLILLPCRFLMSKEVLEA
jgi:hypothetical protein